MQSIIAEQPIVLCIGLAVLGIALLFGWLQSGRRALVIAGVVAFVMMPIGWWVSHQWVTDREQIRKIILTTAAAIEANDPAEATKIIADQRYQTMALTELPRYRFEEAKMTGERRIEIDDDSLPLTAEADIVVRVKLVGSGFGEITIPRRLILGFQKFDGDWKVMSYQHLPIVGKADAYSNTLAQ